MVLPNKLTKAEKKAARAQKKNCNVSTGLDLKNINPLTVNQSNAFADFDYGYNLFLYGYAGTGKSFIGLYLALDEVLEANSKYNKVVIVRSVVPTRDMGFLPGNSKEKSKEYEAPYAEICSELFGRGDAYGILKQKGVLDFITTSFVRGITLRNCIVIVDEIQNMTKEELNSIITRVGENCKIIFCGDVRQCDLKAYRETSGISDFIQIIHSMKSFSFIEFQIEDIVRGPIVKEYIIARYRLEDEGKIRPIHV